MPKENALESGFTVPGSWSDYDDHDDDSNCNNTDNNSVQFLFICVLTQQLKSQLQSEHEWKKQTNKNKVQNKAIYIVWVMMMIKQ
jgi:hypothetical protein